MTYRWIRDLHLYLGLAVSPFLLLFAVSVVFLNHAKIAPGQWTHVESRGGLQLPADVAQRQGVEAIAAGQQVLQQLGLNGEIGFTRYVRQTQHFVFPVWTPQFEANVDVDVPSGTATVSRRPTTFMESLAYLHKMPGPHNVDIRGNWWPTRLWGAAADATIYLVLFITLTGLYLWWSLRAERRVGVVMLSAGLVTLLGLALVLFH